MSKKQKKELQKEQEIERDFYEEDDESYNSLHAEEEER